MKSKSELLNELQSIRFAMYDLLLYLDTHPKDKKAFNIFKELGVKAKSLTNEYTENYGPLTAFDSAGQASFNWLDNPWPWDRPHDTKTQSQCQCGE